MAVALEALPIPTDDHSGRSGLSAFGLACLLRDAPKLVVPAPGSMPVGCTGTRLHP
jgi:hypothetical protein